MPEPPGQSATSRSIGLLSPKAIPVYGVWLYRKYKSGGGLVRLFEAESDAYACAERHNNGPLVTGDQYYVREHVLHLEVE